MQDFHLKIGSLKIVLFSDSQNRLGLTKILPQTFLAATRLGNLPPKALNATKRLLKAAYLSGTKEQKELEQETFDQLVDGAEMKEAFNAFMEKRKPNFD